MDGVQIGKDKNRLWCIFADDQLFYMNGFKALNSVSEKDTGLVSCKKTTENGKIKITYNISECTPLQEKLHDLSVEEIVTLVRSLTRIARIIKDNGMMSLLSTVFEMDKVFLTDDNKPQVIFIPLTGQNAEENNEGIRRFYHLLRMLLRQSGMAGDQGLRAIGEALESDPSLEKFEDRLTAIRLRRDPPPVDPPPVDPPPVDPSPERPVGNREKMMVLISTQTLAAVLLISGLLLMGPLAAVAVAIIDGVFLAVYLVRDQDKRTRGERVPPPPGPIGGGGGGGGTEELFVPTMRLVGQNTPMMVKFDIDKEIFTIGRATSCDGIIPDSLRKISQYHCTIITENGYAFVKDDYATEKRVGSTNGTFINGSSKRIEPSQKVRLQINDTLQLAIYRFKVESIK